MEITDSGAKETPSHPWVLPVEPRFGKHCKTSILLYEARDAFFEGLNSLSWKVFFNGLPTDPEYPGVVVVLLGGVGLPGRETLRF